MGIREYLEKKAGIINTALKEYLPSENDYPKAIHQAMLYSSMAGGKRIRPVLHLAAVEAVGGKTDCVLPFACAIELIHTYSLVHDDLPAMDNADLRRGKPTSHKVYGEAFAVLAGDALLTYAFYLMSRPIDGIEPKIQLEVINDISRAIGSFGLIGGQVVDIESENKEIEFPVMEYIHTHKTGALIRASIKSGAVLGGGNKDEVDILVSFAEKIGLAFQIIDDILDEEGDRELLGKNIGGDKNANKSTYPSLCGMKEAKQMAKSLISSAVKRIEPFGEKARPLKDIALYMVERDR